MDYSTNEGGKGSITFRAIEGKLGAEAVLMGVVLSPEIRHEICDIRLAVRIAEHLTGFRAEHVVAAQLGLALGYDSLGRESPLLDFERGVLHSVDYLS